MRKKIKDQKWEIPEEEGPPNLTAHDVSPSGKSILFAHYQSWDSHPSFNLYEFHPDGHVSRRMVRPSGMPTIALCNFLPDGNILVVGSEEGGTQYVSDRHDISTLTCSILDGITLRPIALAKFRVPKMDLMPRTLSVFASLLSADPCNYRVDFTHNEQDNKPDYYWCEIYIRDDGDIWRAKIGFNKDLTDTVLIAVEGEPGITGFEKCPTSWYRKIEQNARISPPLHHPGRNWDKKPHLIEYTAHPNRLSSRGAIAMLHSAGRVINVSKRLGDGSRRLMKIDLNFGKDAWVGPSRIFYKSRNWDIVPGLGSDSISMAFTEDASRLTVLSYLPYPPYHEETRRGVNYRWRLHSYDVDGRYSEMERTRLRKAAMTCQKIKREARIDTLSKAGLPIHVARLMSKYNIGDKEGIELFRHLRSSGAPHTNSNEKDPLERIDEAAFSGKIPKEDAKWLIGKRDHVELIEGILRSELSVDRARTILVDMGFEEFPEAVNRVIEGADPETVAMIFGIEPKSEIGTAEEREQTPSEIETEAEDSEKAPSRRENRFWRKNRFS